MQEVITVPQDTPKWDLTVKLGRKKENNISNAEGDVPPIRNINMHTVMKSLCASERPTPGEALGVFTEHCAPSSSTDSALSEGTGTQLRLRSAFTWMGYKWERGRGGPPHGRKVPRKHRTETALLLQNLAPVLEEPDRCWNNYVGATWKSSVQAASSRALISPFWACCAQWLPVPWLTQRQKHEFSSMSS